MELGVVIAGGTAPYVGMWLIEATGDVLAPAFFVIVTAAIGIVAVLSIYRKSMLKDETTVGSALWPVRTLRAGGIVRFARMIPPKPHQSRFSFTIASDISIYRSWSSEVESCPVGRYQFAIE